MKRLTALAASCALVIQCVGCATPRVHRKWAARADLVQVDFRRVSISPVEIQWRTVNRHGDSRTGTFSLEHGSTDCESTIVELQTRDGRKAVAAEWVTVQVPQEPTTEADLSTSACQYLLMLSRFSSNSDPKFSIQAENRRLGHVVTYPPRRNRWIPAYPLAVVFDASVGLLVIGPLMYDLIANPTVEGTF